MRGEARQEKAQKVRGGIERGGSQPRQRHRGRHRRELSHTQTDPKTQRSRVTEPSMAALSPPLAARLRRRQRALVFPSASPLSLGCNSTFSPRVFCVRWQRKGVSKPQQLDARERARERKKERKSTCIPSTQLALWMQTALFYLSAASPRANPKGKCKQRRRKKEITRTKPPVTHFLPDNLRKRERKR